MIEYSLTAQQRVLFDPSRTWTSGCYLVFIERHRSSLIAIARKTIGGGGRPSLSRRLAKNWGRTSGEVQCKTDGQEDAIEHYQDRYNSPPSRLYTSLYYFRSSSTALGTKTFHRGQVTKVLLILNSLYTTNKTASPSSLTYHAPQPAHNMAFFRITLIRSAIGLPSKTSGVLRALGLRKRMRTVFHPVSPQVAGQIMKVKELVAVSEVEHPMTTQEIKEARRPDPGFYVETAMPR